MNQMFCYVCHYQIYDLADAEIVNVKVEEIGAFHSELAHKICVSNSLVKETNE